MTPFTIVRVRSRWISRSLSRGRTHLCSISKNIQVALGVTNFGSGGDKGQSQISLCGIQLVTFCNYYFLNLTLACV